MPALRIRHVAEQLCHSRVLRLYTSDQLSGGCDVVLTDLGQGKNGANHQDGTCQSKLPSPAAKELLHGEGGNRNCGPYLSTGKSRKHQAKCYVGFVLRDHRRYRLAIQNVQAVKITLYETRDSVAFEPIVTAKLAWQTQVKTRGILRIEAKMAHAGRGASFQSSEYRAGNHCAYCTSSISGSGETAAQLATARRERTVAYVASSGDAVVYLTRQNAHVVVVLDKLMAD